MQEEHFHGLRMGHERTDAAVGAEPSSPPHACRIMCYVLPHERSRPRSDHGQGVATTLLQPPALPTLVLSLPTSVPGE